MSASMTTAGAAIVAAATAASVLFAGSAGADTDWGINGTFAVSSNGDFARVNERYQDQPGERATWTVSTQCISPME